MNRASHPCPICSAPVPHQARYPRAVCRTCYQQACDRQGRKLQFFNLDMSGGFRAIVAETQQEYSSHVCYIALIKCRAQEARFGGIVIQPDE